VLRQRVITAIVLAVIFLAAVATLQLDALALIFGLVAVAGVWEWGFLAGWRVPWQRGLYAMCFAVGLVLLWSVYGFKGAPGPEVFQPWLGVACLFWSVTLLLVESYPGASWLWRNTVASSLMGWLIMAGAWLATLFLLTLPAGNVLLVLLVLAVAIADIGAYFTGRQWGRHKLAPSVSPGKTWEGLWGGLAGVMALTLLVIALLPQHLSHLTTQKLILIGLALTGASVLGDLTVSMVKRASGVKDSGSLLPGHGGLLDRIDGLCAAAPVFALGLILAGY